MFLLGHSPRKLFLLGHGIASNCPHLFWTHPFARLRPLPPHPHRHLCLPHRCITSSTPSPFWISLLAKARDSHSTRVAAIELAMVQTMAARQRERRCHWHGATRRPAHADEAARASSRRRWPPQAVTTATRFLICGEPLMRRRRWRDFLMRGMPLMRHRRSGSLIRCGGAAEPARGLLNPDL